MAVAELSKALADAANSSKDLEVIVATHHPLATHGVHGQWYRFFNQDLRGPKNRRMVKAIRRAYLESGTRPLIHAAGHDHSLQVLRGSDEVSAGGRDPHYNLVSGAGSWEKLQAVGDGGDTLFAHEHTGFMVVDFMKDGSVFLQVIEPVCEKSSDADCDSGPHSDEGKRAFFAQLK